MDMSDIPDCCVQTCICSPPYWGLRDYGVVNQIGLESTPDEYVCHIVKVFRNVWRVLKGDGTLWLNLGDSYCRYHGNSKCDDADAPSNKLGYTENMRVSSVTKKQVQQSKNPNASIPENPQRDYGLKAKDLIGMPWRIAFALQADGWYLRQDIIWSKPNAMPEPVKDRPTRSHEYMFLMSKSPKYYYDADAIREPYAAATIPRLMQPTFDQQTGGQKDSKNGNRSCRKAREKLKKRDKQRGHSRRHAGFNDRWDSMTKEEQMANGANKRSVWTIATQPYREAHFATFPEALVEPCILAGSKEGDVVLDPFMGSGTVAWVAKRLGRISIGYELNISYCDLAVKRNRQQALI